MAAPEAVRVSCLIYLAISCLAGICYGGDYIITHAPSYLTFRKEAGLLQTSEISKVISAASGFQLEKDLSWEGVEQGNLFKRPKANVLFTVDGVDGSKLKTENVAKFKTNEDAAINTEDVTDYIQNFMSEKKPMVVDFSVDNTVFDVRSHHPQLFGSLPSTYESVRERFIKGESGFSPADLVSLNITRDVDLLFLGELYIIRQIVNTLKRSELTSRGPDFFHLRVMGLRRLVEEHGADSNQVRDAISLLNTVISEMTTAFRELYGDNVVVQVATMAAPAKLEIRKGRSLMEDTTKPPPTGPALNLAPVYDEDYPMIFNIYLWTVIFWMVGLFFIAWGMWFIDPGRDSIIYRMTSQRMKKD